MKKIDEMKSHEKASLIKSWTEKTPDGRFVGERRDAIISDNPTLSPKELCEMINAELGGTSVILDEKNYGLFSLSQQGVKNRRITLRHRGTGQIVTDGNQSTQDLNSNPNPDLEALGEMDPETAEIAACRLLEAYGYVDVEHTGKSGDNGIDGVGYAVRPGGTRIKIIMQCKRVKDSISPSQVRSFVTSINDAGAAYGYFFTTSRFTDGAIEAGGGRIVAIDGETMVTDMREYGVAETETIKKAWRLT